MDMRHHVDLGLNEIPGYLERSIIFLAFRFNLLHLLTP